MNNYWASASTDKIGSEIIKKFEEYQLYTQTSGMLTLWRKVYDQYYKPGWMLGGTQRTGEQGQYIVTCINDYKNLLDHLLTMVTQNRPALDPKATNTDMKSQSQTILSRGLLDYYLKEKDLEAEWTLALDFAIKYGEGFVLKEWDQKEGQITAEDPETGETQNEGDLVFSSFLPVDVARDVSLRDHKLNKWYITQSFRNKFDMAMRYPELAEKIVKLEDDDVNIYDLRVDVNYQVNSDLIKVYRLYHEKTPAMPEGRIVECLREDIITLDGPMPYKRNPLKRIIPKTIERTNFGYSSSFDMLPIQEQSDIIHSIIKTNQSTFGVQNILVPEGSNMGVREIKDGLNLLTYDPKLGKPEPLNLLYTPREIFEYAQTLSTKQETISGVNSVARGNPEATLKSASGSAMALIQSMAIQFANKLEQSATKVLEEIGTDILNDLRTFQKNERTAAIVGESNKIYMKDYTAEDLSEINRVTVDRGNALGKTVAGKLQIAQDLFEKGLIKTADQYYMVLATGKVEVATEGTEAEMLNIKSENEVLAKGEQVPVVVTDNHLQHIQEHKAVIAPPEARKDPNVLEQTLAHIQEHIAQLSNPMNSTLLSLLGQQPVPPPMPPAEQGGLPGPENLNAATQTAEGINMPLSPQNPMTGERPELAEGSAGRSVPLT